MSNKTREELGDMATSKNVDRILEGTYNFQGKMDQYVEKYLKKMKRDQQTREITGGFTRREYQDTWKSSKEKMSSSPHNVHFEHFKAIARDNFLSQVMADAMSIPYMIGKPPERYKKMVACFLRKR